MCNQQQSHRQLQSHNSFSTSRGFLPLLCRLSIKDVKRPKWPDSDRSPSSSSSSSASSSSSSSDDPTSPKVSCIGQVKKRKNNNKAISCPIHHKSTAKSADSNLRYAKLRKLFSGKNLLTNGVVNTTVETNTTHGSKMMMRNGSSTTSTALRLRMPPPPPPQRKMRSCRSDNEIIVNILELDPPLPVVKKVQQSCGRDDQVNLWKRRCAGAGNGNGNGISLRSLQIEQIHVPNNHHNIPPTTV